jgi:two-component system sensor kinase FixL
VIEFFKQLPGLRSGIGRRFILYILLFSSVITFIGTGLQLYLDFDRDLKSIHSTFDQVESSYLDSITNSLWVTDDELLRIQLEGILRLPDMQLIEVRKGGRVLQAIGTPQSKNIIEQTIPLVYVYNGRDVHLGELHVVASLKGVYARIFDRVIVILSIQTIKTFLVSLFIFIIFYQLVGKYIISMASFVESIRFESMDQPLQLDRKSNTKKPDELDQLVTSFNRMQENLARDILRREIVEKELHESEYKLLNHLQNTPVGAISWDLNFKAVEWNQAAKTIFGYTKEEAIGKHSTELILPKDVRGLVDELFQDLLTGKGGRRSTNENITKDGKRIVCEWFNTTLKDADGKVIGIASLVNDITERQRTQKELEKHRNHLKEMVDNRTEELQKVNMEYAAANKELKEFAYIVSHDLKAPLRAISQLTHWISEDYSHVFDTDGKEKMELIIKRAKRMDRLIDGILRYSRISRISEKEESLDLNLLVNEVIENIVVPDHIKIIIEKRLPVVIRDSIRVEQVFQNLIGNAIKFMDKDEGLIRVDCVDKGTSWEFSISDNGPGIDKRYHDKIFQIFQTLTSRDEHESTGIGLTLVKKIIGLYGGIVWVESQTGHGTTFFFILPKKGETYEEL